MVLHGARLGGVAQCRGISIRQPNRYSGRKVSRAVVRATYAEQVASPKNSEEQQQQKDGKIMYGYMKKATKGGVIVEMVGDDNGGGDEGSLEGFLPWQEAPISINKKVKKHETMKELMPLGLQREFTVYEDGDGAYAGEEVDGDVVVSAKTIDQDMMWRRMEQINEHCTYEKENFSVVVNGVNKGGLTAFVAGYPVFVPISQLKRREDGKMWDVQALQTAYMKKRIRITILEVNPEQRRVVCSEVKALENDIIRQLEVGHIIHGKIRKIEKFGAFVGIEGTRASALLHISNISGEHVDHPADILSHGENIKAVIIGMNEDYTNISLSTSVLEKEKGDMVNDKELVFSTAEEMASSFREEVLNQ